MDSGNSLSNEFEFVFVRMWMEASETIMMNNTIELKNRSMKCAFQKCVWSSTHAVDFLFKIVQFVSKIRLVIHTQNRIFFIVIN